MTSLDDLVALVDRALSPAFDLRAATRALGPIDRWIGELGVIEQVPEGLSGCVLETCVGTMSGLQVTFTSRLIVDEAELERAFGPRVGWRPEADRFDGMRTLMFDVARAAGSGGVLVDAFPGPSAEELALTAIVIRPQRRRR